MHLSLARRRRLRRRSTDAETALWFHLRGRRLAGFRFRRQHPCGPFILDFYCPKQRLAIELDGGQHYERRAIAYDNRRSAFIAARGIAIIRFPCDQVLREPAAVLTVIAFALGADN
jgi:very-short-patch-repair endonuclease